MRISLYVTNPSVQRAQEILEANHYCIVAGNPGIGKTTLAEILLANFAREGYELFKLRDDVAEAREVFKPERRQVFYYDDFLGSTTFKGFAGKNEDAVLVRFLEEVSRSPNTRFILTTREYILNQGRQESERLADLALDPAKCVVDLGDYTRGVRAEILYNHLHFSNLPVAYKEALVLNKNYLRIINHKNYSPRIIERMTGYLNVADIRPENFFAEFMLNLENPKRIWEHAFMNHILPASQDLLLCLSSLPDLVDHEDLKEVFESFRAYRAAKYRIERSQYDFTRALKELEGSFIANSHKDGRYLCRFHNPSIRDFLEVHLVGNEVNVQDLLASAIRVEQPHRLVKVFHKLAQAEQPRVFEALVRAFHGQFSNVRQCHGVVASSIHWIARLEICAAIFPLKSLVISDVAKAQVLSMADALGEEISRLHTSWLLVHFVNRLKVAKTHDWYPKDKLFTNATASAIKALQSGEAEMATLKVLSELLEKHDEQLPPEFKPNLTDLFRSSVESELDGARALFSGGDPEPMLRQIDDLEYVASRLGIDIDRDVQEVRELAESLIVTEEPVEDSGQVFTVRSDEGDDRIDSMFQVLLDLD